MKALYITSLHTFSGKTAVCLALGRRLQRDGYRVGYFKPLSTQPWEPVPGRALDEDADFVRRTLGLEVPAEELVGVVLTPSLLRDALCGCSPRDLLAEVKAAYEGASAGRDVVLLEGGASLREGVSVGLGPAEVADALDVPVLAIIRFRNEMGLVDDCLVARMRLGERLLGVLINSVPDGAWEFVLEVVHLCLEERGIPVLGVLPRREELQAISVGELVQVLEAEFLTLPEKEEVLIEQLVVGAMSVEQALPRMRRIPGTKAIITGGDRADMQLAAMETATSCLILTGHLRPRPEILRRAEEVGVPVLLVRENTMETIEAIERVFGKTRLGQPEKMERFEGLMAEHVDFDRLYQGLGLM
ncbi:MAG TPA: phosphotransacetylase family protein [Anaerolineales bacterium]|nr:phosphotransacetylase family protein [Anaerolineae bacterium]HIQ01993.1 phosphotransacetylase family protein [Anaerolineales bacterium]